MVERERVEQIRREDLGEPGFPSLERRLMNQTSPDTIRQYLRESLIDELHLAMSPVLMGSGENLFAGLDLRALGYRCEKSVPGSRAAAHVYLSRRA